MNHDGKEARAKNFPVGSPQLNNKWPLDPISRDVFGRFLTNLRKVTTSYYKCHLRNLPDNQKEKPATSLLIMLCYLTLADLQP